MKKLCIAMLMLVAVATACLAGGNVEAPADCQRCGMNRTQYGYSRVLATFADKSNTGTCSINCAVGQSKKLKAKRVTYQVADYNSRKLIDAPTATWVMGGKLKGVMTPMPKWAFADKKSADAFIKENGGKLATFAEVLKVTEMDLK